MIDVSLPPYNVRGDWNGSDALATRNGQALQDAADAAGAALGPLPDNGGSIGDLLQLPKGPILCDRMLRLPYGVAMRGVNDYGSTLVMPADFDGNSDFVQVGDPASPHSSFGGRVSHMNIWCPKNLPASASVCALRITTVQDGIPLDHVRVYGFKRKSIIAEKGQGGATRVGFRQVTANTGVAGFPAITFDYGEGTMVDVEVLEPSGARVDPTSESSPAIPGTIGVLVKGGFLSISQFHPELLETGMQINLTPRSNSNPPYTDSECYVDFCSGGPEVRDLFVVNNNSAQLGRIHLSRIKRNGVIRHTVLNGQPGANPINTSIGAMITL